MPTFPRRERTAEELLVDLKENLDSVEYNLVDEIRAKHSLENQMTFGWGVLTGGIIGVLLGLWL